MYPKFGVHFFIWGTLFFMYPKSKSVPQIWGTVFDLGYNYLPIFGVHFIPQIFKFVEFVPQIWPYLGYILDPKSSNSLKFGVQTYPKSSNSLKFGVHLYPKYLTFGVHFYPKYLEIVEICTPN